MIRNDEEGTESGDFGVIVYGGRKKERSSVLSLSRTAIRAHVNHLLPKKSLSKTCQKKQIDIIPKMPGERSHLIQKKSVVARMSNSHNTRRSRLLTTSG